jgi:hypothetical protein
MHKKKTSTKDALKTLQLLKSFQFAPSKRCKAVGKGTGKSKTAKTPVEKASSCIGLVRPGRDGKLYVSTVRTKKNPTYRGTVSRGGKHVEGKWVKVIDAASGTKSVKIENAAKMFPWARRWIY